MFHRLPHSPAGLFGRQAPLHLSSLGPLSLSKTEIYISVPSSAQNRLQWPPRSTREPALLPGTLLGPPLSSRSHRPASAPSTHTSHPHTPAPASLRPRRSPHGTAAPPRNTPPARSPLTAHDAEGTVGGRAANGWRGRERTHERLGRSASLGARGKPTRLPHGCDGRSNDTLLGLPGSPATEDGTRPSARTAPPPPPPADPIGPCARRSRAAPASPCRPPRPRAHAGAGLLAAETWHQPAAASAWGSWSRPAPRASSWRNHAVGAEETRWLAGKDGTLRKEEDGIVSKANSIGACTQCNPRPQAPAPHEAVEKGGRKWEA